MRTEPGSTVESRTTKLSGFTLRSDNEEAEAAFSDDIRRIVDNIAVVVEKVNIEHGLEGLLLLLRSLAFAGRR